MGFSLTLEAKLSAMRRRGNLFHKKPSQAPEIMSSVFLLEYVWVIMFHTQVLHYLSRSNSILPPDRSISSSSRPVAVFSARGVCSLATGQEMLWCGVSVGTRIPGSGLWAFSPALCFSVDFFFVSAGGYRYSLIESQNRSYCHRWAPWLPQSSNFNSHARGS